MPRGFASQTKERLKQLSQKGGQRAQASGKGHAYKGAEAREASAKAVMMRKAKAARMAAIRLLQQGFQPEHLALLELSMDELIKYGGPKATIADSNELFQRIQAAMKGATHVAVQEETPADPGTDSEG